jgi:hypothetical protein
MGWETVCIPYVRLQPVCSHLPCQVGVVLQQQKLPSRVPTHWPGRSLSECHHTWSSYDNLRFQLLTVLAFSILRPVNRRRPSSPLSRFLSGHAFLLRSTAYNSLLKGFMVQLRKRFDVSIFKSYMKWFNIGSHLNSSTEL